jgi:hypothetical protein
MSPKVRSLGTTVVLAAAVLTFAGCESVRQAMGLRSASVEESDPLESDKERGVDTPLDVKSSKPAPFFKNSRLKGGLSDQAREIERDLGIR